MKRKLYLLPPGYAGEGSSIIGEAVSLIAGPDYSGIVHLAPSSAILNDRLSEFHGLAGKCYVPPRSFTIKGFSNHLYSSHGEKSLVPDSLLPAVLSGITGKGLGLSAIAVRLVNELRRRFPPPQAASLSDIKGLVEVAVSSQGLPDEVANRIYEALGDFGLLLNRLEEENSIDETGALLEAPLLIRKREAPPLLLLDGFFRFSEAEKEIIRALCEKAESVIATVPFDSRHEEVWSEGSRFLSDVIGAEPEALRAEGPKKTSVFHQFPSREDEVESIARLIKSSFISGRLSSVSDAVVAFPRLGHYRDCVERVFKRYDIPCEIPESLPLSKKRPFIDLMLMLESLSRDYPRREFSSFLVSPHFTAISVLVRNLAPRISLESGIVGGRAEWIRAFKAESREARDHLERVFERLAPLQSLPEDAGIMDYMRTLYGVLRSLGYRSVLAAEHGMPSEGPMPEMREIFSMAGSIARLHKGPSDIGKFAGIFGYCIERIGSEPKAGGVRILEIRDTAGINPALLCMAGLKDGDLPSNPPFDYLLPEKMRGRLGLKDIEAHLNEEEFLFQRAISSGREVFLSHPTMEAEKVFLPSLFLSGLEKSDFRISGVFTREEELLRERPACPIGAAIAEIEGIKSAGKRFSGDNYINVTDIDRYRTCPRRFFIEKVLGVDAPKAPSYGLDPKTIGIAVHKAMEKLIPKKHANPDEMRADASKILDEVLGDLDIEPYWARILKSGFLNIVPDIFDIESELSSDDYSFGRAEYSMKAEPVDGVRLKGKSDRIDIDAKDKLSCVVLDYKTGSAGLSATGILERGESLQLLLYSAMLKTEGLKPSRAGLYSLKDLKISWIPNKTDAKKGRSLDEYIAKALEYLAETVAEMRSGSFPARPVAEQGTCRTCAEKPYCPFIQGGLDDKERQ